MGTGQACGVRQQDQEIPGCGSGPLQRWGFALRELRRAVQDRKRRHEKTAPPSAASADGTAGADPAAEGGEQR
ncbi:hypothetical protein [Sinomonas albida]|uniref:hypothetical protein n=1 Tax=Sinomonas albida TaxID=369942 RepID=UPI0010A7673E|nr:hypothetical protein [Sinomonas albida]